ncbi:hypothetical protein C8J57DRAFT_1212159 [Mycena rebaudengoi]|nr:hypothetical protein C8J57DRAFT_1212159 [Mycena rebaudengoi]
MYKVSTQEVELYINSCLGEIEKRGGYAEVEWSGNTSSWTKEVVFTCCKWNSTMHENPGCFERTVSARTPPSTRASYSKTQSARDASVVHEPAILVVSTRIREPGRCGVTKDVSARLRLRTVCWCEGDVGHGGGSRYYNRSCIVRGTVRCKNKYPVLYLTADPLYSALTEPKTSTRSSTMVALRPADAHASLHEQMGAHKPLATPPTPRTTDSSTNGGERMPRANKLGSTAQIAAAESAQDERATRAQRE